MIDFDEWCTPYQSNMAEEVFKQEFKRMYSSGHASKEIAIRCALAAVFRAGKKYKKAEILKKIREVEV